MHRVRQGLPFFSKLGWEPVVITVDEKYVESYSYDPLLMLSFPKDIEIHKVKALPSKWTRKIGLGSLSMRSYYYFLKKGDELLKNKKFDLVYFSTTAFHVMALGPRWKKKFGVPFVLDIQDPWRNDFYLDKPKSQRPPKFLISYNIDKYLEAYTVPKADGIISVSQGYCDTFMHRYPIMNPNLFRVIPFGASMVDFEIMKKHILGSDTVHFSDKKINFVYIGRGGHDLKFALEIIFKAFKSGLELNYELFQKIHFYFIGTCYAPKGTGKPTIRTIAEMYGLENFVTEITDRIPYFESLFLLDKADVLLVPGSTDFSYTASKIYPYILAQKKLLAVFYEKSSVVNVLEDLEYGEVLKFNHTLHHSEYYVIECLQYLKKNLAANICDVKLNFERFIPYSDESKTIEQVCFFEQIINRNLTTK